VGRIHVDLKDLGRICKTWEEFEKLQKNFKTFGKNLKNLGRFVKNMGQILQALEKFE
jgi:DNA anti-recombination protein RmuC